MHTHIHTYIHICRFNIDVLAQGNAYKPTMEPINHRGPGGDRTHDLQTEATPPAASCPARTLHATEIAPKNATPMTCPWLHWTTDNLSGMHMHTYIHFYSGICTGTGNIFIGEFCMNMLRWFWESTPKWLSFKKRLSFWLQLAYWYGQMGSKDWHFRVAWPGGEPSTSRVTGRCLIHYTTSDSVNYDGFTRNLSSVNIKSTNFEEKIIPGI